MDKGFLKKTIIFKGMNDKELETSLRALCARELSFEKDEIIMHAGDITEDMGLVLDGSVRIEHNDIWGNRTILSHVSRGQFFAETYAILKTEPLLVDVAANGPCRILLLNVGIPDSPLQSSEMWRTKMMSNLLMISVHKNLMLSGRSFHTSQKTIRGRVMAYLSSMSLQESSREFDIPFDRQQLADYLNVERTALSKELGKMQQDGIITVKKSYFRLL